MKSFILILFTASITAILVGGGVYVWQQNKLIQTVPTDATETIDTTETTTSLEQEPTEPLFYSTSDIPVSVSKEVELFDYTTDQLVSMAQECGNEQSTSYFDNLVSQFNDVSKTVYTFRYTGASQESDTFIVTLLPNKPGYSSLDEFKRDFDQCYAGGDAYPTMLSDDWLLFINSCGSGFDDGSGKPIGCQEVRDVVEPTLKLNEEGDTDTSKTYSWDIQGITFKYPEDYNVLESSNVNSLAITISTAFPEGDISIFWTRLEVASDVSLEERLAEYSKESAFTQDTEIIGDREFIKVTLHSDFGDYTYTRYLIEFDGKLLDYKVGKGEEDVAMQVLGSIEF